MVIYLNNIKSEVLGLLRKNKYTVPYIYEGYRNSRRVLGELVFPLRANSIRKRLRNKSRLPQQNVYYETLEKPRVVIIESNNTCNLNCRMCETQGGRRSKGEMDMSLYMEVVREMVSLGYKTTKFSTINEPLYCSDIVDKLQFAEKEGLRVPMVSNGTTLNKFMDALDASNWYPKEFHVRFSIDGVGNNYNFMRTGARFDKLVSDIRAFKNFLVKHKINHSMAAAYCVTPQTIKDIPKFYRIFKKLFGTNISFSFLNSNSPRREENDAFVESYRGLNLTKLPVAPCSQPFQLMSVLINGDVSVCCRDYDGDELVIGNVNENSLIEIWHGERARKLREMHNSGNYKRLKMCSECYQLVDSHYLLNSLPYALYLLQKYSDEKTIVEYLLNFLKCGEQNS